MALLLTAQAAERLQLQLEQPLLAQGDGRGGLAASASMSHTTAVLRTIAEAARWPYVPAWEIPMLS